MREREVHVAKGISCEGERGRQLSELWGQISIFFSYAIKNKKREYAEQLHNIRTLL